MGNAFGRDKKGRRGARAGLAPPSPREDTSYVLVDDRKKKVVGAAVQEPAAVELPAPPSFMTLNEPLARSILAFVGTGARYMLVNKRFNRILSEAREAQLEENLAWMRKMRSTIYEQFMFCEKFSIHRSSPLVHKLRVVDRKDAYGVEGAGAAGDGRAASVVENSEAEQGAGATGTLRPIDDDMVLEEGRIVSIRRQTQLSNFAEMWRQVGTDSDKTETFSTTFEHLWESLNLKRWVDRSDIVWVDEKNRDVSDLVNELFDTMQAIQRNVEAYQETMLKCMWHFRKVEFAAAAAYEKKQKEEARRIEAHEERMKAAGKGVLF